MKKRITFLMAAFTLLAVLAIPMGMRGQTATFTPSDFNGQGTSGTGSAISATVDGVTFACDKGFGTTEIRCYSGGIVTISSSNTITALAFTFSGGRTGGLEESYSGLSTTSWQQTLSSQARFSEIVVTYTGGDSPAPTTYTVTYKANGPEADDVVVTYNEGANVTLKPANTFTYEGYTFSEWNTQADGDGDVYEAGDVIEGIEEDMTLYAIWTENTTPSGTTATLNIEAYAEANSWVNGTKYTTATVAPVTFTANGGGNTGKYYTSGQDWRFYQGESASITITVPDGYTLVSVTPTYSVSNGGVLKNGNATIESGTTVSVSGTSVTFTVGNSGSATNGQVRFTNIDVVYVSDGGTQTASDLTITNESTDITFDLYNNTTAQVISYTTSSTGAITITPAESDYFSYVHDATAKTITVTPTAVTPSAQTVTISQAADDDYYAGTATFTVSVANSDPNIPGTENNPYTVAQARAAIDANAGTQGVYATGIVSAIPTAYNSTYGNVTFNMVDEAGDEVFLQAYRCGGDEAANVTVGDVAVVYGNLTYHAASGTYEFGQGCTLVSLTHPTGFVEAPSFNPVAGTYTEAQTVTISCETPNVNIYYTLDGTDPDDESTPYNGAITVSETTTIKAIAYDGDDQNSAIATATYHFCSADDPYTVTEALAFHEYPANGVYVHGIVSTAPTQSPTSNGELTYYISVDGEATDQLEVYKGKGLEQADFTAQDNIQLGDIVTIYGDVVIYGTNNPIKEFAQGNYLVSFERPAEPIINANNITLAYDATSGVIEYTITNPVTGTALNATTDAEWISNIVVGETSITFNVTENEGTEDRTATVTLTYAGAQNKEVTVTQEHFVVDYATLPFEYDGNGLGELPDGLTQNGLTDKYNNSPKMKFDNTGDWLLLQFNERPGTLTFDIKGNPPSQGSWAGTFTVQTSEDGENYTDLEAYTSLTTTVQSAIFDNLDENVRYIRWIYTNKVGGNVALGNIHLYEFGVGPVLETYDLTIEPFENLEIFTFIDDELTEPMEGAGTIQVTEGVNVMLSVSAIEGYIIESLMVDGVDHVNDIGDDLTYTFVMPGHNVTVSATAVADVPFEPATYTLVTSTDQIASGKTYIIVGFHEDEAFAMGEQRSNNRKGVAISVEGNTATVETAEVHEVVINTLETDGFYSIYDGGYLYAASSSGNQLKTKAELDVNGQWEISFDTTTHIVASNSENRNVMQFNYNGGNTLFSCYSSASQSPVYLYVKDETPTTLTQTVQLTEGWNWFSTYLEIELEDLQTALTTALPSATSMDIKSIGGTSHFNGSRWRNTSTFSWDISRMFMINVPADCEIELTGMPIDLDAHPIIITANEINWIGYPFSQPAEFNTAITGFDAVNGDVIKSPDGSARYTSRWRTTGQFTEFEPNKGYIFDSKATTDRTLIYQNGSNAKKRNNK